MSEGYLTTHVLDTALGAPAAGLRLTLFRLEEDGSRTELASTVTNPDGRTDGPLLPKELFTVGQYELLFYAGDYLRAMKLVSEEPLFLDEIPLRFGVSDADEHYHVPLLLAPFSYSTYRGS